MTERQQMRVCGACQGWVEVRAVECRHCGAKMKPLTLPEPRAEPAHVALLCPGCRAPLKGDGPCPVCAARDKAREEARRYAAASPPPPSTPSPGVQQAGYEPIPVVFGEPTGNFYAWIVVFVAGAIGAGAFNNGNQALAVVLGAASWSALGWILLRSAVLSALRQDRRERR